MNHELRTTAQGVYCSVCGGQEGTLTTHCPGYRLSRTDEDMVWAGVLDYRDGTWKRLDEVLETEVAR